MRNDDFEFEIFTPEKADAFLAYPDESPVPWSIVKRLDQARIRAIADVQDSDPDEHRLRRIMTECSALVAVLPYQPNERYTTSPSLLKCLCMGAELGLPIAVFMEEGVRVTASESGNDLHLQFGASAPLGVKRRQLCGPLLYSAQSDLAEETNSGFDRFLAEVRREKERIRPYAFFIGRLEQDFSHAREAIRVAVETEAGIPCLWSDDGRHRMNVESVCERTRLLLKHATFVIADLTLGVENPERENPSRAHEIGMTIAYGRKLMLCSQEPRRYPYFSIGDMQMMFWSTEADLADNLREWIRTTLDSPARTVLNYGLSDAYTNIALRIKRPVFTYDASLRYVGPKTKVPTQLKVPLTELAVGALGLALAHLATLYFGLGSGAYWVAYLVVVFAVFVWPHLNWPARVALTPAKLAAIVLAFTALMLLSYALAVTKSRVK